MFCALHVLSLRIFRASSIIIIIIFLFSFLLKERKTVCHIFLADFILYLKQRNTHETRRRI